MRNYDRGKDYAELYFTCWSDRDYAELWYHFFNLGARTFFLDPFEAVLGRCLDFLLEPIMGMLVCRVCCLLETLLMRWAWWRSEFDYYKILSQLCKFQTISLILVCIVLFPIWTVVLDSCESACLYKRIKVFL